ncbi:response regulator [Rhodohalobacter sp. 614A]|uniref:response regulator n=1 Tax=Rhodohalobacter sp. 614A TaxID=2908649 RepID=UPI001F2CDBCD|nr:response regulator transcription factor [Rhodohalobacter sp. 614A]
MAPNQSIFKKKVLIVDDHSVVRKGITGILELEKDLEVTHQLETAEQLLEIIDTVAVDLMIVDISLPGMNGIELVKNVIFQKPDQKILILSRHEESIYAERALRAGAKAYVMKFEASEVLVKAVRKVLNGGLYVSEELSEKLLLNTLQGKKEVLSSPLEVLSDRELEVFELIGKGMSSNEIALQLHLSPKTIETYRSRIKDKLNFKNSTELMFNAVKWIESEF